MINEELISRVSNTFGYTRLLYKTGKPTWLHNNAKDGLEFNGFHVIPFKIIDGERNYDEKMISPDAVKVVKLIEVENIGEDNNGNGNKQESEEQTKETVIAKPDEVKKLPEKKKEKSTLQIGTFAALAKQYNFPVELANLFFMKFEETLYVKNAGLLYLANKKGYGHIEVTDKYNIDTKEWEAECKIYPLLTKELIDSVAKLDKDNQSKALEILTQPTNGKGRAGDKNIKMSTMKIFAQELAQTRAQNRALRAYTGYGGTSAEEREDISELEYHTE